jgi:hypothetical protein
MSSSWSCSHLKNDICDILKMDCTPGKKGCVLYGKVKFSNNEDANEVYEKRVQKKMKNTLKK